MPEVLEVTGQKREQDAEKWAEVIHPVSRDHGKISAFLQSRRLEETSHMRKE
jgi:hypothetical protein